MKADIAERARECTDLVLQTLVALLSDETGSVALGAARELLDRGYGKAAQPLTGAEGGPVNVTLLHLVAAREVSAQLAALLGQEREQAPPLIEGTSDGVLDLTSPALE